MVNVKSSSHLTQKDLRKIRVEKLKQLRFNKNNNNSIVVIKNESQASLQSDPLSDRKVRNRVSAHNSRMKKMNEMSDMQQKMSQLEKENQILRSYILQLVGEGHRAPIHDPSIPQYSDTLQNLFNNPSSTATHYNQLSISSSSSPSSFSRFDSVVNSTTHCANIEPALF